ncbi:MULTISPECIES: hypothetical protein [unclassified Ruegeria]|uniref:hypothetical protein n=1 Tax=unclassified Ruegeria TaxID=2625375 RepID=UPI001267C442|nr:MULTISPECIES: hypothetical protein [unclassified Ruegeria]QFT75560.1 hypothetical protein FIU92_21130 [Ruegeria sp. THAF33]
MVSRTDYLLNEVEHFAPYSQFDQSAPREDRVSEQIDIIMKEQQAMGYDRAAIASKSFDIEDQANRRVDEHTAQKDLVEELKIELEAAERSGEPVDLNDMQALVSQHMNDAQEYDLYHPYYSSLADLSGDKGFQDSDDYQSPGDRYVQYMQSALGQAGFENYEQQTKDIVNSIENMEALAREVEDPHLRAAMDVQIGELKGDVAELRPYDTDLQAYTVVDDSYTTSMNAAELDNLDPSEAEKWLAVRDDIVATANSFGLDGNKFLARYNDHDSVSVGTTATWRDADISTAAAHFNSQGVPDSYERAEAVVGELHQVSSSKIAAVVQEIAHTREQATHVHEYDGHSL